MPSGDPAGGEIDRIYKSRMDTLKILRGTSQGDEERLHVAYKMEMEAVRKEKSYPRGSVRFISLLITRW